MRRLRWPMLAGVIVVMSGCAAEEWVKADATQAQVAQDARSCEHEASREALRNTPASAATVTLGAYATPMDAVAGGGIETARLTSFCMRARGYALAGSENAPSHDLSGAAGGSASPDGK
jgi:hypothetical protein